MYLTAFIQLYVDMSVQYPFFDDRRSVSPVIGVVLMIGIVVALGAVIGGSIFGLGTGIGETAPNTQFDAEYDGDEDILTVTHVAGDTVDGERLTYSIDGDGFGDNTVTSGDSAEFNIDNDEIFEIRWESSSGETSTVLFTYEIPAVSSNIGGISNPSSDEPSDLAETLNGMEETEDGANIITTDQELQAMSTAPNEDYVLGNDIDASLTSEWNDNNGFDPIGDSENAFTGSFDGQGHEITGLTIDRSDETNVGLFGVIGEQNSDGGIVEDVRLTNAQVSGDGENIDHGTGVLAGSVFGDSTFERVHTDGVVSQASGESAGGLIGVAREGDIEIVRSSSTANVIASESGHVGGLVGYTLDGPTVTESYATGNVVGDERVGGLIGFSSGSDVSNSYTTGSVNGNTDVGGLIGLTLNSVSIENTYAVNAVSGNDNTGGLIGNSIDGISDSYWDIDTTDESSSAGGDGLTTEDMTGSDAESTMNGFDFENTWATEDGEYPILQTIDEERQLTDRA